MTLAPENVTPDQVKALAGAGILVALGHSDADFATCLTYAKAGASCVTHLFNAMSQLGNREPGLVGAALTSGALSAGLIADGVHVHPATMRTAWAAKTGPGQIYLVSDAMAVAGTNQTEFFLEGRHISRKDGRLTLEDGTLAGADLDLTTALSVLTQDAEVLARKGTLCRNLRTGQTDRQAGDYENRNNRIVIADPDLARSRSGPACLFV